MAAARSVGVVFLYKPERLLLRRVDSRMTIEVLTTVGLATITDDDREEGTCR